MWESHTSCMFTWMTHRPPLDELNSRVLTYDTNTIAMIWKPEDINIVSCIAPYCLHLFGSLKPSCLVWLSLHSFSVYSHRLKSALKGLLILFWKPLSFVQILIQTSRCLLPKFNLPVKFIWFRYTHNMRRRERVGRPFGGALATFVPCNFGKLVDPGGEVVRWLGSPLGNTLLPGSCVRLCPRT